MNNCVKSVTILACLSSFFLSKCFFFLVCQDKLAGDEAEQFPINRENIHYSSQTESEFPLILSILKLKSFVTDSYEVRI